MASGVESKSVEHVRPSRAPKYRQRRKDQETQGTFMNFHYNNNNQEPTGFCNNLLVVPYIDGKADIITKLRKLNYCAKPFESSYKNKLITKSLIFKTGFYVNISVVTATFLLTLEICVHLSCL
jgi:hypothetical protein